MFFRVHEISKYCLDCSELQYYCICRWSTWRLKPYGYCSGMHCGYGGVIVLCHVTDAMTQLACVTCFLIWSIC